MSISEKINGDHKETAAPETSSEKVSPKKPRKKIPCATREDYVELFECYLGSLPRDIFTKTCMMKNHGAWVPAEDWLDLVRTPAHEFTVNEIKIFHQTMIKSYFHEYEFEKTARLIPEIPKWDERDRIFEMALCLRLDDTQAGFDEMIVDSFLRYWLIGVFKKIEDPRFQNPVLIFKGNQGIGKEYFINTLTDGFEQWSKNISLTNNDRDNLLQLSHCAVLKIPEFDQTARFNLAMLKDMIFRDSSYIREAYAAKFRDIRCYASFVGSCNPDDFYRDPTGNRRFAVLNLQSIDYSYATGIEHSKQVLAQAKQLFEQKWEISKAALKLMSEFLDTKRPDSPGEVAAETWENIASNLLDSSFDEDKRNIVKRGWITNKEAEQHGLNAAVTKATSVPIGRLRSLLVSEGLYKFARIGDRNTNKERGYSLKRPLSGTGGTDYEERTVPQILEEEEDFI